RTSPAPGLRAEASTQLYRRPPPCRRFPMWFQSSRKSRHTAITHPKRGTFRPRLEALEDRRLLSAGALDVTFNGTGLVTTGIQKMTQAPIVVYPDTGTNPATDGKIVAGGYAANANGYNNFALTRYSANGVLDTTF